MNLLTRVDFLPEFVERLKDDPESVVADFKAFRDACSSPSLPSKCGKMLTSGMAVTDPKSMRISVKGDILALEKPASTWNEYFKKIDKFEVRLRSISVDELLLMRVEWE